MEIIHKINFKHTNANLINASGSPIALNRFEGGEHQFWGDSSGKRMNFLFSHSRFPISI
jgi:hypothetical protein